MPSGLTGQRGSIVGMASARRRTQAGRRRRTPEFPRLLGERLCLDFANTVEAPHAPDPVDFLESYRDVVVWTRHVGAIHRDEEKALLASAATHTSRAVAVFERALALRGAIQGVFGRIAAGEAPRSRDLDRLQDEYRGLLADARLQVSGSGSKWARDNRPGDLDAPLWHVADSAIRLLADGDLSRIRECPGAGDCGWLFYDTSKNGRRRWCSMEGCGSRVKMRRRYARERSRSRITRGASVFFAG
jgi:predicted RNA-binding Zn ribbon-like protein